MLVFDLLTPPRKRLKPNLLHKPLKTVLDAHKKRKQMSPLGTGKTVPCMATTSATAKATSTLSMASEGMLGMVTVSASAEEMKTAIAALLALCSDLPQPDKDETAKNVSLLPINPIKPPDIDDAPVLLASTSKDESTTAKTPTPKSIPVHKRFVTIEYKT